MRAPALAAASSNPFNRQFLFSLFTFTSNARPKRLGGRIIFGLSHCHASRLIGSGISAHILPGLLQSGKTSERVLSSALVEGDGAAERISPALPVDVR